MTGNTQEPQVWSYKKTLGKVAALSTPIAFGRFIRRVPVFWGTVLMASIDSNNLVASAIISPIVMLIVSMATGSFNTMNTTIGKLKADKELNESEKLAEIRKLSQQGLLFSILIGGVCIAILTGSYSAAQYISQSTVVADLVLQYFIGYVGGIIPNLWFTNYLQLTVGLDSVWPSTVATAISSTMTIALYYLLAMGFNGLPKLGMLGFGLSFSISSILTVIAMVTYLKCSKFFSKYIGLSCLELTEGRKYFKDLTHGIPIGLKIAVDRLSLISLTVLAGWIGHDALMALEAATQYLFISMVPLFGLATTAGKFSAQLIKGNNFNTALRVGAVTMGIGYTWNVLILAIYAIFPYQLASLFIDPNATVTTNSTTAALITGNQDAINMVPALLLIIGIGQFFGSTRSIISGALRGYPAPNKAGIPKRPDTWFPMYIAIFTTVVLDIFGAYAAGFLLAFGLNGIVAARSIGLLVASLALIMRIKYHIDNRRGRLPAGHCMHKLFCGAPISSRGTPLTVTEAAAEYSDDDDDDSQLSNNFSL